MRGVRRISDPGDPPRGGTVYLCAADAAGMMVSLIQSNYMGFGSGVVVPGTGISLQNRGAGLRRCSRVTRMRSAAASVRSTRSFRGFVTQDRRAATPRSA